MSNSSAIKIGGTDPTALLVVNGELLFHRTVLQHLMALHFDKHNAGRLEDRINAVRAQLGSATPERIAFENANNAFGGVRD